MSDLRLSEVIATLALTRDRLLSKAEHAEEAITALRKLLSDDGPEPAKALPAEPPAPRARRLAAAPTTPTTPATSSGSPRPTVGVCEYEPCGKSFPIPRVGRLKRFCSSICKAAKQRTIRQAITDPTDELLARKQEPIPETGPGMKARLAKVLEGPGMPESRFLQTARTRNAEAARRSAAAK